MRRDYEKLGLSIQEAMLDHAELCSGRIEKPPSIVWGELEIRTGDRFIVPKEGRIRARFLSPPTTPPQGFDLKVDGWIKLGDGSKVEVLRTWNEPGLEPEVEYEFHTNDGTIWVWNVYKQARGDMMVDEKWTGNAGFWVEDVDDLQRVYHCSPGPVEEPDFESLRFRIEIIPSV